MLDSPRIGAKVVEMFGNLAAGAQEFAVDVVAQTNLAIKEATPRKMAALRAELEGPDPGPIERLLVERVVFCWLILWEYEAVLALQAGKLTARSIRVPSPADRRGAPSLPVVAAERWRRSASWPCRTSGSTSARTTTTTGPSPPRPAPATHGSELPTFADRFGRIN